MSALRNWGQLLRVPNTLTATSDVLAGFALLGGIALPFTSFPIAILIACLGSISLYWAGMVLNDVFDLEVDRTNQREGPLVTNRISLRTAATAGVALLLVGVTLEAIAPWLLPKAQRDSDKVFAPAIVSIVLALTILGYDWAFKKTKIAPLVMGCCRGLNMMLGCALAWILLVPSVDELNCAVIVVVGHILFATGITLAARKEFEEMQQSQDVLWGWACSFLGGVVIACSPLANDDRPLHFSSLLQFQILIAFLLMPWARHAIRSIQTGDGKDLGAAIRQAIRTILFLDAAISIEYSGFVPGAIVCALIVPTFLLGYWFRST